uniref:Tail fiber assembly protein n=1 Tax=Myoviridae sp. ctCo31 TaxID=2825053 RepID=A0A8S5UMG1_9CAUD|nr:MAG TPA: tail fiber assembly protein [Myoviridae sp. ctCo31]
MDQTQLLQQQNAALKIRVFDAEEELNHIKTNIQSFLNGVADLLQQDQITLQTVYDYIKNSKDTTTESAEEKSEDTLLLEGKE